MEKTISAEMQEAYEKYCKPNGEEKTKSGKLLCHGFKDERVNSTNNTAMTGTELFCDGNIRDRVTKIESNEIHSWWAGDPFKVERLSLSSKEMLTEGTKFDQIPMISIQRKELDDGNE